jgi:alkylation response protein AidB-like acyl-CoA dehydrogenase
VGRDRYTEEQQALRGSVRAFLDKEITPYRELWDEQGQIDRSAWRAAGAAGLLGLGAPESLGGGGQSDFRYRVVVMEEMLRAGAASFNAGTCVQDDLVLPYLLDLGTPEQLQRWVPPLCSGDAIGCLAMTEPGAGSDLRGIRTTARRTSQGWSLTGSKTFITNGVLADVALVFARTVEQGEPTGFSMFVVPTDSAGFRRGRPLKKLGLLANDTGELFLDEVSLPPEALLGVEGRGFVHLMERLPRERMSIAATSLSLAAAALEWTSTYCFQRTAFGKPIGDFQNTRFVLAELETEVDVGTVYLDSAVRRLNDGVLSAVDAAKAKLWLSDLVNRVVDRCVQLHGGYGYMREYLVGQAFTDARVQSIYGGTNEIMKEIIGRDIAARHA